MTVNKLLRDLDWTNDTEVFVHHVDVRAACRKNLNSSDLCVLI